MAHTEYSTQALVIETRPSGETASLVLLYTEAFGTLWVKAAGLLRPQSKLADSLTVGSLSQIRLVKGRAGWRLIGAVSVCNYYFMARDQAAGGNHRQFFIFLRVLKNIKRFFYVENPDPAWFADSLAALDQSLQAKAEPDVLIDWLAMYHLGYVDAVEATDAKLSQDLSKLAASDRVTQVDNWIASNSKRAKQNIEQAMNASHL